MKNIIFVVMLVLLVSSAVAQRPSDKSKHKEHFRIENIVSDLSASQKKRLNTIYDEDHKAIEKLRNEQKTVRDSIQTYIEMSGDHTAQLNPLFERESSLQAAISKQMYATRLRIEDVLTDEQNAQVRKYFKEKKEKDNKNKKTLFRKRKDQ